MDRPRAHSTVQVRAPLHARASKLFQKVSAKFSRSPQDASSTTNSPNHQSPKPLSIDDHDEDSDVDSPASIHLPLSRSDIRPAPPSRPPPPTPLAVPALPALDITPATPVSPSSASASHPPPPPPIRRTRSQTLVEGRNWSRPSSQDLDTTQEIQTTQDTVVSPTPSVYATAPSTRPVSVSMSPSTTTSVLSASPSTTSSYATAHNSAFTLASSTSTLTISGLPLPVLPRAGPAPAPTIDGLPRGAAPAADPHAYSPVRRSFSPSSASSSSPLRPTSSSPLTPTMDARTKANDPRRSWVTARAGDDDDSEREEFEEEEGEEEEGDGDEGTEEGLAMGMGRERADTLRVASRGQITTPSPSASPTRSIFASTSTSTSTDLPHTSTPSASPSRASPPPRAATLPLPLPPIYGAGLDAAHTQMTALLGSMSGMPMPMSASPSSSPALAPASLSPSLLALSSSNSNPGGMREELGRLSPSIIIPVMRLPSLPTLPPVSPGGASTPTAASEGAGQGQGGGGHGGEGSVGRRSSVIFGPHAREASRSVVRSMPALAMEGGKAKAGEDGAAGEEEEEDEDEGSDEEDEGEEVQAEDGDADGDEDSGEGGTVESPFVPLRLDVAPLSLDIAGIFGGKGKGKAREGTVPGPGSVSRGNSLITPTAHPWHSPAANSKNGQMDYFSVRTPTSEETPRPIPMSPAVKTVPMPQLPTRAPERPGMYKHASRSMVDILQVSSSSVGREEEEEEGGGEGEEEEDSEDEESLEDVKDRLKATAKAKAKAKVKKNSKDSASASASTHPPGEAPAYEPSPQRASTLKRRRSMPEIMAAPPPYTLPLFPSTASPLNNNNNNTGAGGGLHPLAQVRITPRDDEGREVLPPYSNDILLRGVMPRKMEFTAPGVQAKDRKWRRVLCELEGTVFRVYRCAGEGWWERRVGVGDATLQVAGSVSPSAAAAAAKARAAREREGQEVSKIAGEEGRIPGVGGSAAGDGEGREEQGTTEVIIPPRSSMSSARSGASSGGTAPPSPESTEGNASSAASIAGSTSASRSRLNLGISLLKPRSHGRSKSEMPNPPKTPTTPTRSSLSIPRPSFGGSSSSGASSSGSLNASTSGAALAPSRSNASLVSARSRAPSTRGTPSSQPIVSSRAPATPMSSKGKWSGVGIGTAGADIPEPDPADLLRAYTLQHGESGLGNDYLKRKHVIRVRLEGEQFLLQARDVGDVVDWIEGFHSATNIALDLDERVMPKGPLFPRRRRRRPRPANGAEAPVTSLNSNNASATR
ncbi:hypothetical protein R3P38DRAFT_3402581 [Favolaschia claudopus]|uniref:PH domain-containing protein n=1 Tax=Favolaschia claudopus TaxID=2862362 RepID=A0AAW0AI33_9AGAR